MLTAILGSRDVIIVEDIVDSGLSMDILYQGIISGNTSLPAFVPVCF